MKFTTSFIALIASFFPVLSLGVAEAVPAQATFQQAGARELGFFIYSTGYPDVDAPDGIIKVFVPQDDCTSFHIPSKPIILFGDPQGTCMDYFEFPSPYRGADKRRWKWVDPTLSLISCIAPSFGGSTVGRSSEDPLAKETIKKLYIVLLILSCTVCANVIDLSTVEARISAPGQHITSVQKSSRVMVQRLLSSEVELPTVEFYCGGVE
ncbi:hypothetical protein B0H16DRAFT_1473387 [Mycena metata]|uniref:Uncharacterized protein n=1 Tax=Mycena metata TaxID=1033252 RepID=A0AAD7HLA1_9AGAR|nr:hypothetical protein B0H16DRAFT_1473387 [Mycena metata]